MRQDRKRPHGRRRRKRRAEPRVRCVPRAPEIAPPAVAALRRHVPAAPAARRHDLAVSAAPEARRFVSHVPGRPARRRGEFRQLRRRHARGLRVLESLGRQSPQFGAPCWRRRKHAGLPHGVPARHARRSARAGRRWLGHERYAQEQAALASAPPAPKRKNRSHSPDQAAFFENR